MLLGSIAAALVVAMCSVPAMAEEGPTGRVTAVNAVENVDADLYLDGSTTPSISGFRYSSLSEPLLLPAGSHTVALREAGAPATSAPLFEGSFDVGAGASLSLVAFRGASGLPRLVVFADEQPRRPSQALLRFRQVAQAPEVDVLVDGHRVLTSVPNAENQGAAPAVALSPGARSMSVVRAGTDEVLVPPQRVQLAGGGANSVYLIGSQSEGSSLAVVAENQSASLQSAVSQAVPAPSGVPAGASGLIDLDMDDPRAIAKTLALTMVAGGALFLAIGTWSRHRRQLTDG